MIDKKKSPAGAEAMQDNSNTSTDIIDESSPKDKGKKNKYWVGVLYPENMRPNWQEDIGDLVELPYAYCIHDADNDNEGEDRKTHVHIILAFPNTTTYKNAFSVYDKLSADGKKALNRIEAIVNIRGKYNYLIHDTETCRKKGKKLYPKEARITGNNFDIGSYEQIGIAEKNEMCKELCTAIIENGFTNFGDFFMFVVTAYEDASYFELVKTYSGLFERLTKSNYQKRQNGERLFCDAPEEEEYPEDDEQPEDKPKEEE